MVKGSLPVINPFPMPGLRDSLPVVASPTVGSITTLGLLGGWSTFSDDFLLLDEWACPVALGVSYFFLVAWALL